jgi:hypothetical protein
MTCHPPSRVGRTTVTTFGKEISGRFIDHRSFNNKVQPPRHGVAGAARAVAVKRPTVLSSVKEG